MHSANEVCYPYEKQFNSSVLLVYLKKKKKKLTFSLRFMYFSEIYLKLHLSLLELYFERV